MQSIFCCRPHLALRIMSNSEAPGRPLTFVVSAPTQLEENLFYDPYFVPPEPPKLRAKPQQRCIGPGKIYADHAAFEEDLRAWIAEREHRKASMADRERFLKRLRNAHRDRTDERLEAQRRSSTSPQPQTPLQPQPSLLLPPSQLVPQPPFQPPQPPSQPPQPPSQPPQPPSLVLVSCQSASHDSAKDFLQTFVLDMANERRRCHAAPLLFAIRMG